MASLRAKRAGSGLPAGRRGVVYDGQRIEFDLILSRRKSLAIQVRTNGAVIVRAPLRSKMETVDAIVRSRGDWIRKQQNKFAALATQQPVSPQYAEGATHRYLGRDIRLKLTLCDDERIALEGDTLAVYARNTQDARRIERMVGVWFRQQADALFRERLEVWLPVARQQGIPDFKTLTLRDMKSRWGSCSARGRVTLNVRLIHVPVELLDYVIAHELCHLKELNHGKGFYALMNRVMPGWKARRDALYQIIL